MIDFNPQKISFDNVDRFYIKKSIYDFIISNSGLLVGDLLDIGCGEMPYKEEILKCSNVQKYFGLDIYTALEYKKGLMPDYYWDGTKMPFNDGTFNSAIATEVLEHCPNPKITLHEINRVLSPNSPLMLTMPFLWPTHEAPNDFFRYTPFAINKLLDECGFKQIEIVSLGGWDASLAQMIGLWIKRRGFSLKYQKRLFFILRPFIKKLIKIDIKSDALSDQRMFTNLGVIAWKG